MSLQHPEGLNRKSTSMTKTQPKKSFNWRRFLAVAGPGLMVMLADTDAGSIITAAQSGAEWGYRLLWLQFILVPVLYIVQELTVRIGLVTGRGHADLIQYHFGAFWGWFSVVTHFITCIGALLSELSGLSGIGTMIGIPAPLTMILVVGALLLLVFNFNYLSVERIAIFVGAFELAFLLLAIIAKPDSSEIRAGLHDLPFSNPKYLYLISANLGAVIMPWMVFFQQSSVVEKRLTRRDLGDARLDTFIGAVVTQIIMAAVLIATAATIGKGQGNAALDTVQNIAEAITPYFGETWGRIIFGLGLSGAALVATIVVTLTAARSVSEILGVEHGLEHGAKEAPWFYGVYTVTLILAALFVLSGVNLVSISISVQVLNAMLLPIVLGFLFLLARRLPEPYRLKDGYAWLSGIVILATVIFGVYSGLAGLGG